MLKTFLYRDDGQVMEYLEQLLGGRPEGQVGLRESRGGRKGGGVGLSLAGVTVGGGAASEMKEEAESVLAPTGASNFEVLYGSLDERGEIKRFPELTEKLWETTNVRELVEFDVSLNLSRQDHQLVGFSQTSRQVSEALEYFSGFRDVVRSYTDLADSIGIEMPLGEEGEQVLTQLDKMAGKRIQAVELPPRLVAVCSVVGANKFRVVATLQTKFLVREANEIEGEATIMGKVRRKLAQGEKLDVSALSSLPGSENRAQRRTAKKANRQIVSHPALLLEPIAVFR